MSHRLVVLAWYKKSARTDVLWANETEEEKREGKKGAVYSVTGNHLDQFEFGSVNGQGHVTRVYRVWFERWRQLGRRAQRSGGNQKHLGATRGPLCIQ